MDSPIPIHDSIPIGEFDGVRVHRIEARIAVENGRAASAPNKLGAVREGVLRRSLELNGRMHDQLLWSILETDWRPAKAVWGCSPAVYAPASYASERVYAAAYAQ